MRSISKETKLSMTKEAEQILKSLKVNPEMTTEELIASGCGESGPEIEFIRAQLEIYGYL